jgi:hypothetical protein
VKHSHFVCGSFEQRVGQGELGEAVASASKVVSTFFVFINNICAWPVSFKIVFILHELVFNG